MARPQVLAIMTTGTLLIIIGLRLQFLSDGHHGIITDTGTILITGILSIIHFMAVMLMASDGEDTDMQALDMDLAGMATEVMVMDMLRDIEPVSMIMVREAGPQTML